MKFAQSEHESAKIRHIFTRICVTYCWRPNKMNILQFVKMCQIQEMKTQTQTQCLPNVYFTICKIYITEL